MDFKDQIKQIAERIEKLKDNIPTEEATKNAFIMPFIQTLGYDVFNPLEVLPEMSCDIGTKKGEKIDYAIMKDGVPMILVECKHWAQDLNLHDNQLLRYFHVSKAKFGILTNGILYRFYTDLETPNKMDEKPFLEINMLDLKESQIEEVKKFHKSYFDIETILSSASELKYMGELKTLISKEFINPTPDFVKYFGKQIYDKQFTPKIIEQFTYLVKRSIASHISDMISERLKAAIKDENKETGQTEINPISKAAEEQKVITTEEEKEAFFIIKSILRSEIEGERITFRDAQTYFSILIDDNNRKPVCRLYLNSPTNKCIAFIGEDKKEIRHKIEKLDDIYMFSKQLIEVVNKYV
ncbi:MAG: type I restriction enzyme HsdR N-terminal domain-containing protein [Bacteroidales bacterium]|jgi:hypothetical protein|nr:type I restriction enzyme HsdR N-terminal domain-containing protein [Bacteroidales bacterium]